MKIPLYNCYWCKCAWCVLKNKCDIRDCIRCKQIDKKGILPYLKENCDKYLPETIENKKLIDEVQKCRRCKYKRMIKYIKGYLENKNM